MSDLRTLRVADSVSFEAHGKAFTVKRLTRGTYHLRDHTTFRRSRLGTLTQIREDVRYAVQWGVLPPAGDRW